MILYLNKHDHGLSCMLNLELNLLGENQYCSKAKDLKVEAKDFKVFLRPRTHKPRPRTWVKATGIFPISV